MTKNVGSADKLVRIVIGVGLLIWGIVTKNWLGAIGFIPLVTALMNWCPLYSLCGGSTCQTKPTAK
ncbi:DUF2892 domain-containing protein [bacterium]|nr:DUF2892 domain-containing protein [bacterium]